MEFPADLATNYYELAVVSQIFWTFYILRDESQYGDEPLKFDTRDCGTRQFNLLRAEQRLRGRGNHVLVDIERNGLWVFSFTSMYGESVSRIMKELGLTVSAKDSLWAGQPLNSSSNKSRSTSLPGLNYNPKLDNKEAFKYNAASSLSTEEDRGSDFLDESPKTIYAKFTRALSSSMAFALAHERCWLLLDSHVCINEESRGLGSSKTSSNTVPVTFHPRWNSSGSLLIRTAMSRIPKLVRADAFVTTRNDQSLLAGTPVLLPPSGLSGIFLGVEASRGRRTISRELLSMRAIIETYFYELGLEIPVKAQWIRVGIAQRYQNQDTEDLVNAEVVECVWPACYCLCRAPQDSNVPESNTAFYGNILDPLSRAQAWYNDRFERAKVVKAEEQKKEREARLLRQAQDIRDQDSMDPVSPMEHRTIIQDASGVYPTPPDGVQSQSHNTPVQSEILKVDHDNPNEGHGAFTDTPYPYSNQDHQDLLSENDMGLTEADFEFFDDLNANDPGLMGVGSISPLDEVKQGVSNPDAVQQTRVKQGQTLGDKGVHVADAPMGKDQEESAASVSTSVESKSKHGPVSDMQRNESEIVSSSSSLGQITISQDTGTAIDARSLTLPHNNDIDRKYSSKGRYGFEASKEPSTLRLTTGASDGLREIPELGLLEGSASDTEETSELASDESESPRSCDNVHGNIEGDQSSMLERHGSVRSLDTGKLKTEPSVLISRLMQRSSECPDRNDFSDSLLISAFGKGTGKSPFTTSDPSFIQIAQILIDQALFCDDPALSTTPTSQSTFDVDRSTANGYGQDIARVLRKLFPQNRRLLLKDLADHTHEEVTVRIGQDYSSDENLRRLPSPYSCIKRMDSVMEILPSALSFWEELSLAPAHGPKEVLTIGLIPKNHPHLEDPVKIFLRMVRDAYQACGLGNHNIIDGGNREYNPIIHGDSFWNLGSDLGLMIPADGTLVVYLINTESAEMVPPLLCAGMLSLLDGYRSSIRARELQESPDIVVKIVLQTLIFSPHHLVIPSTSDYKKIAFEVYDRCGPPEQSFASRLPYLSAPAVYLARPIPQKIDFQLTPDPSSVALASDNQVHLAYVWEPDNQWLTASWTDNAGILQWNAAYWIGEDCEKPWQPFIDTFKEIIATTVEMLRPQSRAWEIYIAKSGRLFLNELSSWKLVIAEIDTKSLTFAFLSVTADPNLKTLRIPKPNMSLDDVPGALDTPAATPNASGQSPEAQPSASTPGGPTSFEHDLEARLIDVRDETWAFLPKFDLDDPHISSKFCRARKSAYLLKQASAREEDGVLPLAVRIINGGEADGSLWGILEMYHKLASLARIRGMTDHASGILPYHVAAASKAHAALQNRMQYEDP